MNSRFPDEMPEAADAPLPAAAEQAELLALAEELERAHPDPRLSADFPERVLAELTRASGLRALLRRSRLAQAAATILVVSISVAPVLALVQILPWLRETKLVIQVERLLLPPRVEAREETLPPLPQPGDPAAVDPAWIESMTRQNRMARAAISWAKAASVPAQATSLEPLTWEAASAEDLWQEFLHRCAQGGSGPLAPGLVARIDVLSLVGSAADRRLLAPWTWVLSGTAVSSAESDRSHAWAGAPWIAD